MAYKLSFSVNNILEMRVFIITKLLILRLNWLFRHFGKSPLIIDPSSSYSYSSAINL